MHNSLVFLLNKPLLWTAPPTLHNKVNTSPQRLRYETQNSPLGGESVRDRRRQVSRDLANSCLQSGEWWGSLLFPQLPVAAVTNLKVTSFPRDYLKRKGIFIIMNSLLSYSLLFPNYPYSHPHLQEDFCIHKVSGNKAYKHSHTNKLPDLTPAYNCVWVGVFPAVSPVLC